MRAPLAGELAAVRLIATETVDQPARSFSLELHMEGMVVKHPRGPP